MPRCYSNLVDGVKISKLCGLRNNAFKFANKLNKTALLICRTLNRNFRTVNIKPKEPTSFVVTCVLYQYKIKGEFILIIILLIFLFL